MPNRIGTKTTRLQRHPPRAGRARSILSDARSCLRSVAILIPGSSFPSEEPEHLLGVRLGIHLGEDVPDGAVRPDEVGDPLGGPVAGPAAGAVRHADGALGV